MAYPPGEQTVGRAAHPRALGAGARLPAAFEPEELRPTLVSGDLALTSTVAEDGTGARAQVVRRQSDGTWLRVLDPPELFPHQ
jgi:hypothetical protein